MFFLSQDVRRSSKLCHGTGQDGILKFCYGAGNDMIGFWHFTTGPIWYGILTTCPILSWDETWDRRKKGEKKSIFCFRPFFSVSKRVFSCFRKTFSDLEHPKKLSRRYEGLILSWDFCCCSCPRTKEHRDKKTFLSQDKGTAFCLETSQPNPTMYPWCYVTQRQVERIFTASKENSVLGYPAAC